MKVVIDGNIGSGKTTQLNLLEKVGWTVQREPIDDWPLELFYKDKSRWALLLQMKILQTLQPVKTKDVVVYERCLLSTRYVFWDTCSKRSL
jgi:deoxyadenosine/deoxycytidine kinase